MTTDSDTDRLRALARSLGARIEHPDLNYVAVSDLHPEWNSAEKRHLAPERGGCPGCATSEKKPGWRTVGPMPVDILALFRPCLTCLARLEVVP